MKKEGQELKIRIEGLCTFNSSVPILHAALAGCGLGFLPEDMVTKELADGWTVAVDAMKQPAVLELVRSWLEVQIRLPNFKNLNEILIVVV